MDSLPFSALSEHGLLGLVIAAQSYWILRQERRYETLREQARGDLLEAQEALLQGQKACSEIVNQLRRSKDGPPSKP